MRSTPAIAMVAGVLLSACERPLPGEPSPYPAPAGGAPAPASSALRPEAREATGPLRETVITAKIKAAIASEAALDGSDISVSTDDGVVTLSGRAKDDRQAAVATQLAQRQEGVRRVDNRIEPR